MRLRDLALVLMLCLLAPSCGSSTGSLHLVLATTTSVGNSGLLDVLLPAWQAEQGVEVRVSLAGSGRALRMMEEGLADVAISHAPSTEAEFLARHPRWLYSKIMFTDFVLVGPDDDPSGVRGAGNIAEAMRRIAAGGVVFVSRADQSGTHEREEALWRFAGVTPRGDRVIRSGAGMATTLRQTDERGGYTLADRPTFDQLSERLRLSILFAGGPELLNPYAVLASGLDARARRFAEWLASGRGRTLIARFQVRGGRAAYQVWPDNRERHRPEATPFHDEPSADGAHSTTAAAPRSAARGGQTCNVSL